MLATRRPSTFTNEPIRTFRDPADRAAMEAALRTVQASAGGRYPLVIGGERIEGSQTIASRNPARPAEIIGDVVSATLAMHRTRSTSRLRRSSAGRGPRLRSVPICSSALLRRFASARTNSTPLWCSRSGRAGSKPRPIQQRPSTSRILRARSVAACNPPPLVPSPLPESNVLRYLPLGVGAVIPPWNFALAIMAGMTCAAIVTGNTVVLKPSPDAAVVAARFVDLLHEIGAPAGVVNFLPGDGPTVGEALVGDARTRFVSFTGSKAVGLRINEIGREDRTGSALDQARHRGDGRQGCHRGRRRRRPRRGGRRRVASAFGFRARSVRLAPGAIVDRRLYDRFVEALVAKANRLSSATPSVPTSTWVRSSTRKPPKRSPATSMSAGAKAGSSRAGAGCRRGIFLRADHFRRHSAGSRLAQEEIFGPVLAVIRADDFESALAIANETEFGLTGAVYTRDPQRIEQARDEFFVGNLYINRKCTGALWAFIRSADSTCPARTQRPGDTLIAALRPTPVDRSKPALVAGTGQPRFQLYVRERPHGMHGTGAGMFGPPPPRAQTTIPARRIAGDFKCKAIRASGSSLRGRLCCCSLLSLSKRGLLYE